MRVEGGGGEGKMVKEKGLKALVAVLTVEFTGDIHSLLRIYM